MEDKLYLNSITDKELNNLNGIINNYRTLYIQNSLREEVLCKVNDILSNHNIPLLLDIDLYEDDTCADLSVLHKLSNLKQLDIFVSNGEVSSLSALDAINNLEVVELRQNFKKNISLEPLKKFHGIKKFQLDNGLSVNQYTFINELKSLENLQTFDLDLGKVECNVNIRGIRVCRKLSNANKIKDVFPNLTTVYLEKCKDVDIVSSISQLSAIEHVWLRYMNHVVCIPLFSNSNNIKLFQTTSLSKLNDISNLFKMKNIEALMMTELEYLTANDFVKLAELKCLKVAYVTFKDAKENEKFHEFCKIHKFICKQPALVDDKFDM